jgi:intracellular sulfur oxidation DsrE/DsrF family protein
MRRDNLKRPDSPWKHKAKVLAAFVALCLVTAISGIGFAAEPVKAKAAAAKVVKKDKVVFQVSDADSKKWNLALNNAKNVQADLGKDKTEIEIVAYGPGIGMLKADSEVANRIEEALAAGVKVVACENTMRGQKLTRDDMLSGIGYVPAGVVELMKRQKEGYAYIRP